MLDEEHGNWREMENTVCGKLEYSEKWRRHVLLNENKTKPDCASTRKSMIDALEKRDSKYRENLDTKNLKSIMHLNSGIYITKKA